MKKIISLLMVVLLAVFCLVCINKINKLEADYNSSLESAKAAYEAQIESMAESYEQLNASKVELEEQIYNCLTGEAYEIMIDRGDETHFWTCTDNKGLFTDKSHIICY